MAWIQLNVSLWSIHVLKKFIVKGEHFGALLVSDANKNTIEFELHITRHGNVVVSCTLDTSKSELWLFFRPFPFPQKSFLDFLVGLIASSEWEAIDLNSNTSIFIIVYYHLLWQC